jgi:GNAT superfamily N-acetyltransferase
MNSREELLRAETCLFEAWRAPEVADIGGWQVRAAANGYGRLNSAWTAHFDDSLDLAEAIARTEAFYGDRALAARFMVLEISAPGGLDDALAACGYRIDTPTLTLARDVDLRAMPDGAILAAGPTDAWLDLCRQSVSAERQRELPGALGRLPGERIFGAALEQGEVASIALAVRWQDHVAVECVVTRPGSRGKGLAQTVLRAIEAWAAAGGARRLVLAVAETNVAARRLYAKAGFSALSRYHYRERA